MTYISLGAKRWSVFHGLLLSVLLFQEPPAVYAVGGEGGGGAPAEELAHLRMVGIEEAEERLEDAKQHAVFPPPADARPGYIVARRAQVASHTLRLALAYIGYDFRFHNLPAAERTLVRKGVLRAANQAAAINQLLGAQRAAQEGWFAPPLGGEDSSLTESHYTFPTEAGGTKRIDFLMSKLHGCLIFLNGESLLHQPNREAALLAWLNI